MAKNEFPNTLKLHPKYLERKVIAFLPNFGRIEKLGKELTLDELVDWYRANDKASNIKIFLGVIPPNYKSPFDKPFPKAPINKVEDEAE
jgi:hypothetical protein